MHACRVAIYLRVSTDTQTVENQRLALRDVAIARGWSVVDEISDEGISGAHGRDKRPGFERLHQMIRRRRINIVAAWSVDRLGRSLQDLVEFLGELHTAGVDLYLDRQGVDTTTPAGRALFQMLGVFAEFERAMIRERIHAGVARAREHGTKSGRPIGRPPIDGETAQTIRDLLDAGTGMRQTARLVGVGVATVARVRGTFQRAK